MLFELVYNSIAVPGDMPEPELERILSSARRKNASLGVTGVLLYRKGEFVQLLEGEREAVEHVYYERIARDPRHVALSLNWEQTIPQRSFADWSMGFPRTADLAAMRSAHMDGYLAGGAASLDLSGPASSGRALLLAIYERLPK